MDENGGNNPAAPRLDTSPQPNQSQPPQESPSGPSIPAEMPAPGPVMSETIPVAPPVSPAAQVWQPTVDPEPLLEQAPLEPQSSAPSTGKGKKIILIAVAVLIGLGLLGGAGFAGYSTGYSAGRTAALDEFQRQQLAEQEAANETIEEPLEEVTLELGATHAPEYKDEVLKGKIGEQIEASDGLVLLVTNIERNFKTDDVNYQLDEGKELVKVNFVMGNLANDRPKDLTSSSPPFNLEEAGGARLTPESIENFSGKFDSVKIDPGAQASGSIVFAVKKDAKKLSFVREQRYRITNQNREVTTRIEIALGS